MCSPTLAYCWLCISDSELLLKEEKQQTGIYTPQNTWGPLRYFEGQCLGGETSTGATEDHPLNEERTPLIGCYFRAVFLTLFSMGFLMNIFLNFLGL